MKFIQHTKLVLAMSISTLAGGLSGVAMAAPQELIDGLGDESYQQREKSEIELAKWAKKEGEKGLNILSDLKKKTHSPEVKSRLGNIISGIVIFKAIPGTRGYMGVQLNAARGAVDIIRVMPNTPAAKGGFLAGDRIIWIDGIALSKKNTHVDEAMLFVLEYIKGKKAGEKLTVKIQRNGEEITKILKLADFDKASGIDFREGELNPFGDFNNRGIEIIPMQLQGQGRNNANPLQRNKNIDPKLLLELKLMQEKLQLENPRLPIELKALLERQKEQDEKRLQQLKKKLNLEGKKVPEE